MSDREHKAGNVSRASKYALCFVLLLLWAAPQAGASPHGKNLLGGRNPSFEKGLTNWFLTNAVTPKIAERSNRSPHCGIRFLRITGAADGELKQLYHQGAKIDTDGLYKFTIRARVIRKGNQRPVIGDLFASQIQRNGSMSLFPLGHAIKNTNGEWVEYSGQFRSDKNTFPRLGFYAEFFMPNGGKIDFDCARIEKVMTDTD